MSARRWSDLVYAAVRLIPRGRVATYGQIAALLGRPRGAREVGWALHGCRDVSAPCHRVVDRNGRLAPHFIAQRSRLKAERVQFEGDRVALSRAAWRPTPDIKVLVGRLTDSAR